MKAKITRPDGTTIEAEGAPEEIAKLSGLAPAPVQFVPYYVPVAQPLTPPRWPWETVISGIGQSNTGTTFTLRAGPTDSGGAHGCDAYTHTVSAH